MENTDTTVTHKEHQLFQFPMLVPDHQLQNVYVTQISH